MSATQPSADRSVGCPKCGAARTYSGGSRKRKGDGVIVRMRRCPSCHCQFTDPRFAPANIKSRFKLSPTAPNDVLSSNPEVTATTTSTSVALVAHHRLELDLPSDWSPTGLQGFTAFAEHALRTAGAAFDQPILAELEWQRLDPNLRAYIRARARFELALALQWNAVFNPLLFPTPNIQPSLPLAAPNTAPHQPGHSSAVSHQRKQTQPVSRRTPNRSGSRTSKRSAKPTVAAVRDDGRGAANTTSTADAPPEEPERALTLTGELERLRSDAARWTRERLELKQQLFRLESEKDVLHGKWVKVKTYLERTRETGQAEAPRDRPPNQTIVEPTQAATSTVPLKPMVLSRAQEENIERLASVLMAHLVRREGYRVNPRELPEITGEKAPWKTVITHLLGLGKVEHAGKFIAISLVERLRRHLPGTT
jgi:hypothetical protein